MVLTFYLAGADSGQHFPKSLQHSLLISQRQKDGLMLFGKSNKRGGHFPRHWPAIAAGTVRLADNGSNVSLVIMCLDTASSLGGGNQYFPPI